MPFAAERRQLRGYDEIGKHAGFRFQCRKACGFESHYPYQKRDRLKWAVPLLT